MWIASLLLYIERFTITSSNDFSDKNNHALPYGFSCCSVTIPGMFLTKDPFQAS